jgi:predicted metalloenzyme YecM
MKNQTDYTFNQPDNLKNLTGVLANYHQFIHDILERIRTFGIDVSTLNMDHIGYQAATDADYDNLKKEFDKLGKLVSEKIVNGRRVGIYELNEPMYHDQYVNTAIELVAPKKGQICPTALEHVEFVVPNGFADFMKLYPHVQWDISAISQPVFPMIKLKLSELTQVKFHLKPVLQIVG